MAQLNVAQTPLSLTYLDWKAELFIPASVEDFQKLEDAIRYHWHKLKVEYVWSFVFSFTVWGPGPPAMAPMGPRPSWPLITIRSFVISGFDWRRRRSTLRGRRF